MTIRHWDKMCVFFMTFLLVLPGCERKPNTSSQIPATGLETPTTGQPLVTQTAPIRTREERLAVCQSFITSHPLVVRSNSLKDDAIVLKVDSNRIYDEVSLSKWIMEISRETYLTRDCPWKELKVAIDADDLGEWRGVSRRMDFELHEKGVISTAEWVRRFEVQKIASPESLKLALKTARQEKDHEEASGLIAEISSKEPQNQQAKIIKANILLDQGLSFEAIELYQSLPEDVSQSPLVLFNLALARKHVGSFSDAIAVYQNLLKLGDFKVVSQDNVLLNLADAYLKNNQPDDAEKVLNQVKQKKAPVWQILQANLLRAKHETQKARDVLAGMTVENELSEVILFNLILLDLELKDVQAARERFSRLKNVNANFAGELAFLPVFKEGEVEPLQSKPDAVVTVPGSGEVPSQDDQSVDQPLF